ncbi:MAG: 2-succinyl-5-enolpyruvyl-6-hydroxy-3-cyclohexene-1-carboxylate synthase, partial [Candidatus Omnitrophica bacterium]|nr:2-succinyl-5-enolpyruvyl-6-hydroxy-3-cyclohexene-1-carboxylate synthase [Candidatus Omnitrophota bacterium]
MNLNQPNLNLLWATLIVEELIRNGVDYFCISPGSRSAPLTIAIAQNKKTVSLIHCDERGSAFHALGYSAATGKPCAVVTTSGSALGNLFPAVIEASKKKVPLILLTADRPPELRFTGANQTIDQVKFFGEYVRWSFDLPTPTKDIPPQFLLTTCDQLV